MHEDYTLVLEKDGDIIFSSKEHGIKPLLNCVSEYGGKQERCVLYDVVIGIAAARLISYSGFIVKVNAGVISENALQHLNEHKIETTYQESVAKILNRDGTGQCPMELMSADFEDDGEFFLSLSRRLST